jgi:hypothetical protein
MKTKKMTDFVLLTFQGFNLLWVVLFALDRLVPRTGYATNPPTIEFEKLDSTAFFKKMTPDTDITFSTPLNSASPTNGTLQLQLATEKSSVDTSHLIVGSDLSGFTGTVSLLPNGSVNDAGTIQLPNGGTFVDILAAANSPNLYLGGNTTLTAHTSQTHRSVTIASAKSLDFGTTNTGINGTIRFEASTSNIKVGHAKQATTTLPTFSGGGFAKIASSMTLPSTNSLLDAPGLTQIEVSRGVILTIIF